MESIHSLLITVAPIYKSYIRSNMIVNWLQLLGRNPWGQAKFGYVYCVGPLNNWKVGKKVNHDEMLSSRLGDAIILNAIRIRLDSGSSNHRIWWSVEHFFLFKWRIWHSVENSERIWQVWKNENRQLQVYKITWCIWHSISSGRVWHVEVWENENHHLEF